jgi:homoserine kinase type II
MPLLRNAVTASGIGFEWHGRNRWSGAEEASTLTQPRLPIRSNMQQSDTILQRNANRPLYGLPTGSAHGALVHPNVFFLGDKVSGVINFRHRHDDAYISDIADVLVGWCSEINGGLSRQRVQALLNGYQSVRTLVNAE